MASKPTTRVNSKGETQYLSPTGKSYSSYWKPKGEVLGASDSQANASGSIKDLSIALANQGNKAPASGSGSIKDLSIGLAQGNKITQADITRAQSGGASLTSLSTKTSTQSKGSTPSTPINQTGVNTGTKGTKGTKQYSRYGNDSAYDSPVVEEPSYEEIQKQLMRDAQKEVNSLYKYQNSLLQEQQIVNDENVRMDNAVNVLSGLSGSSEANVSRSRVLQQNEQANEKIRAQVQTDIQKVLAQVRTDAQQQYQFERQQANLDAETASKLKGEAFDRATTSITTLAQSGATAEGYAKTDPEGYQYLASQVGGEEILKSMFTLNRPQEQVLDKKIEGGKYIISYQNPLDGKVRIETVDLGLPPQYTKTIDAGNRILAIPDNWNGDPSSLITINKGLTPQQAIDASGGGANDTYATDLDAIIGATKATITSKFGQQTFSQQISRARNDADKINLVASVVLGKADSQTKQDFANQSAGIKEIDKAIALLDSGVKTGVLQNATQYTFNILGKDFDPNLAKINQHITSAIQPYRNSITGAAWGDQEDGEYNMLFGSTRYSPTELRQRLVGVKEIMTSKSANALNVYVNPMGTYSNPFDSSSSSDIESQKQELRDQGYTEDQITQIMNS